MKEYKVSERTRPARAGLQIGEAIVETINLLYLDDNAFEYLQAVIFSLSREMKCRKVKYKGKGKRVILDKRLAEYLKNDKK